MEDKAREYLNIIEGKILSETKLGKEKKPKEIVKTVTVDDFEKKTKDDNFIRDILDTLQELYLWKIKQYDKRIIDIQKQITKEKELYEEADLSPEDRTALPKEVDDKILIGSLKITLKGVLKFYEALQKPNAAENLKRRMNNIVNDTQRGLKTLVGKQYDDIKNNVCTLISSLEGGMKSFTETFQNIVITGPAGVGKTTLARYLAYYYNESGILSSDIVYIVSRSDLVGQYLGQTALKTKKKLIQSLEGIILIDEAYQLGGCPTEDQYGMESITELVNFLDKYMALSIVIVAGYQAEMEQCFFDRNEGLRRRFPNTFNLVEYEFYDLFMMFIKRTYEDLYIFFSAVQGSDNPSDVYKASMDTLGGIYKSFEYLNAQKCKKLVKKKDEDGQYIKNPDGTYAKVEVETNCYFPSQGGDVGILTNKFYNYYYSKNVPANSFIGAVRDLGLSKKIDRKRVDKDETKLETLFSPKDMGMSFPKIMKRKTEKTTIPSSVSKTSPVPKIDEIKGNLQKQYDTLNSSLNYINKQISDFDDKYPKYNQVSKSIDTNIKKDIKTIGENISSLMKFYKDTVSKSSEQALLNGYEQILKRYEELGKQYQNVIQNLESFKKNYELYQ
jgi:DNA replication protein DnaC